MPNVEFSRFKLIMIMAESQAKSTKKWIDYSDESEEQNNSDEENNKGHSRGNEKKEGKVSSIAEIADQLKMLEDCDEEVWLLVQDPGDKIMSNKVYDLKREDSRVQVYRSRQEGCLDIRAPMVIAKKIIQQGFESIKKLNITVHERNFKKRYENSEGGSRGTYSNRDSRGGRRGGDRNGDRNERGGTRGRGRDRDRRPPGELEKKKTYVDKEGQAPDNKKNLAKKLFSDQERKYSRKQAEERGEELAFFRTKPLEDRSQTSKTEEYSEKANSKTEKSSSDFWTRKDPNQETDVGKKQSYKEKEIDDVPKLQQTESNREQSHPLPIKKKYSEANNYKELPKPGKKTFYKEKKVDNDDPEEQKEKKEPAEKKSKAESKNRFSGMMSEDSDN